jgi:hypothetical protein
MKVLIHFLAITFFLSSIIVLDSCNKEPNDLFFGNTSSIDTISQVLDTTVRGQIKNTQDSINNIIDSAVAKMSLLPIVPSIHPAQEIGREESRDNTMVCNIIKYKWAPGEEEGILMDPSSEVIFLGGLVKLETIQTGTYNPVVVKRKPLVFSTSITNINGSPSGTITDPSKKSSVMEAIQLVLNREVNGSIPAKIVKTVERIYTKEQASIAANARFNGWGAKVSATFNWSDKKVKSRYLVKFYQEFFSLSVNLPSNPSDFLKDPSQLAIFGNSSPVYVSNMKYGRVAMFSLESEQTEEEMGGKVDASFSFAGKSGSLEYEQKFKEMMSKSTMKVLVAGGDPTQAASINSPESFQKFIEGSANFTKNSQPVPIAYTLRFLKNNEVAKVVLATEYSVQSCQPIPDRFYEMGTVGGGGGEPFEFRTPTDAKLLSVQVNAGDYVDGLTFRYLLNSGEIKSVHFGGNGGRFHPTVSLENVKLTGISGRYGRVIDKLKLHYSDGSTSQEYGGGGGDDDFSFQVSKKGDEVIGFFGRNGRLIDALGVICKGK